MVDGGKGSRIEEMLGARDASTDTDQGRSFQGFRDFLMSSDRKEESSPSVDSDLSSIVTRLLKGIIYQKDDATRWYDLLNLQRKIRDSTSVPGLELIIDEAEGYAYLRSRQKDEKEAEGLKEIVSFTKGTEPSLIPFLLRRPLHALELANDWTKLLAVVGRVKKNPRPDIYLRQVDIDGVHSKKRTAAFLQSYLILHFLKKISRWKQKGSASFLLATDSVRTSRNGYCTMICGTIE